MRGNVSNVIFFVFYSHLWRISANFENGNCISHLNWIELKNTILLSLNYYLYGLLLKIFDLRCSKEWVMMKWIRVILLLFQETRKSWYLRFQFILVSVQTKQKGKRKRRRSNVQHWFVKVHPHEWKWKQRHFLACLWSDRTESDFDFAGCGYTFIVTR